MRNLILWVLDSYSTWRGNVRTTDPKKFIGNYWLWEGPAKATMHIAYDETVKEFSVDMEFLSRKENTVLTLDGVSTFMRSDGALVTEAMQTGLWGGKIPVAQEWFIYETDTPGKFNAIRKTYEGYMFKGVFGGYWFADRNFQIWHRK